MSLTSTEEAECLRFLDYANWADVAGSFQLGFPATSQPEFLIRDAFTRINEQGIELVRKDLCALNAIEAQIGDTSRLKAAKLGDLTLNENEFGDLRMRLTYWLGKLASDLGGYPNPFGAGGDLAGGRNARVG